MKHRRRQRRSGVGRSIGANVGRVALALVASWIAFIVLLLIPMAVPDEPVIARYEAGVGIAKSGVEPLPIGGLADSFMECVEVLMFSGENRIDAIIKASYPKSQGNPCVDYHNAAANKSLDTVLAEPTTYFRYWHGSSVLMRPVFAYLGMPALKAMGAGAVVIAVSFWFYAAARNISLPFATAMTAVPALMTDLPWLSLSVHHALGIAVILTYTAFLLTQTSRVQLNLANSLLPAAAVGGALTSFVDVLNVAPIGWAVMCGAVAAALLGRKSLPLREAFGLSVLASTVWMFGFGSTWFVRWVLAVPVAGLHNVIDSVQGAAGERAGVRPESPFEGFELTLAWWDRIELGGWRPALVVLAVAGVVLLVRLVVARGRRWALLARVGVAAWAAVLVPIWFLAFGRHAADHGWFMYRGWAYALGIVAAAAFIPLPKGGVARGRRPFEENLGDTPRLPLA